MLGEAADTPVYGAFVTLRAGGPAPLVLRTY